MRNQSFIIGWSGQGPLDQVTCPMQGEDLFKCLEPDKKIVFMVTSGYQGLCALPQPRHTQANYEAHWAEWEGRTKPVSSH